jgi:hypothetical protein
MPDTPANSKTSPRRKRRRWLFRGAALACGLLLPFIAAEVALRFRGQTDADGNFFWKGRALGGIHPQVAWVREKIDEYHANPDSRMIADPHTGWSPRPNVTTHKGMYRYESHGIRCGTPPKDYALTPAAGVTRIAIYGDSFAHADDVPIAESWGRHLENALNGSGRKFEVINFGVSAYGMDQAFLRWRHLGRRFSPQIVLFGFQAENVNRNVNLLRGFYVMHTGIPFSKPRFILDGSGRLKAINEPTLDVDAVPGVMADMDHWKLANYEWFYNPEDYRQRWWHRSRFLSLLVDHWPGAEKPGISRAQSVFEPDGEPERVTLRILREFGDEVKSQGGQFIVVHLPKKSDLQRLRSSRGLVYERLWRLIEREQITVDPIRQLLKAAEGKSLDVLFASPRHAHYSDRGNRIIADTIATRLLQLKLQGPRGLSGRSDD